MPNLILTRVIAARARIKREHLAAAEDIESPLGDWYATLLKLPDRNAFVFMSSRTQLSFLMLEGERLTAEKLGISLVRGLYMVLQIAGFPESDCKRAMEGHRSIRFCKAADLSLLGVLTNVGLDYEAFIAEDGGLGRCSLDQIIMEINSRPARRLGFATPLHQTAKLLGLSGSFSGTPH